MINVDELWLKGKNRPQYFRAIKSHLKDLFKKSHGVSTTIINVNQRLVATSEKAFARDIQDRIINVPGVHSICLAEMAPLDLEEASKIAIAQLDKMESFPKTFKVTCKRINKQFDMRSMDAAREMGAILLRHYDGTENALKVDVRKPQVFVDLKIHRDGIYVSTEKRLAIGGLPWGTSGHLVTMLSGGFDSPIASYMMARRGCKQTFVFFYAYPYVGEEVKEKLLDMASKLGEFQRGSKIYIVPFGDLQDLIAKSCKEEYRTLLFRRIMVECSTELASRIKASALLTGDALGQVSSQTLENISYIDRVSKLPIFRPLIGFNKIEIVNMSKVAGTHDISVRPHDDACSLFAPKHPVIRPDLEYLKEFESSFKYEDAVKNAVDRSEIYAISSIGEVKLVSDPIE